MTARSVRSADGVAIALEDAGPRDGAPVVLLHGLAQSRDVWRPVLDGPLAEECRLVAVDLRGHGDSDKPDADGAYASERLGDDLHAVIEGLGLARPVVVAWSYAGVVAGAYLRRRGSAALGGLLLVAAAVRVGKPARALFGDVMMSNARGLMSDDPAVYEAAARAFVAGCPASPLEPAFVEQRVAAMLRVPAHVRRSLLARADDYSAEIAACNAPIATVHGARDDVVLPGMSELVASLAPEARGVVLGGVGHLPWVEAPGELVASVRAITARARGESVLSPSTHDTRERGSS